MMLSPEFVARAPGFVFGVVNPHKPRMWGVPDYHVGASFLAQNSFPPSFHMGMLLIMGQTSAPRSWGCCTGARKRNV